MEKTLRAAFAPTILSVRQKMGMTQEQLASATDLSRRTISDVERGVTVPRQAVLDRILVELGMSRASDWDGDVWQHLAQLGTLVDRVPAQARPEVMRAIIALLMETIDTDEILEVEGIVISGAPGLDLP